MQSVGERIRMLRKLLGLTQEEFAKRIGRTKSAIAIYEAEKRIPDNATLILISKVYNVNLEWLKEGKGEIFIGNYIPVEFYEDYKLSAGYGIIPYHSAKLVIQVSEELIREKLGKLNVSKLIAFPISGNSMTPTIPENSIGIFIDYSKEGFLIDGEIYAFRIENTFYVKRISKNPADKTITFISDNPEYKPFTLKQDELENLFIIGRYIGCINFNSSIWRSLHLLQGGDELIN